jgi:hypothetical protein
MLRRLIQTSERNYLFSPDDQAPLGDRFWAIIKLRVTDELTEQPPASIISLETSERGFTPRIAGDGLAALVGIPRQVFPRLGSMAYTVHVTISAEGYVPRELAIPVGADPNFPRTFTTPPVTNVALHREPIVISGRTVRANGNTTSPVAGATISVTGLWRMAPAANVVVPPSPPNLFALRPPLYSDRAAVTQFLRRQNLPPLPGTEKTLVNDLLQGANQILLSNRQGLNAGNILLIDTGDAELSEFIAIKTVPLTSPADQATLVTLDYPVNRTHRRNALVQQVMPQPLGPQRQFTVDAIVGDACVFLDGSGGLAGAQEVQVNGPPGPDEHHELMQFSVLSNADGYYRMPPLSRVAQVVIHAEKIMGGQTFRATSTFRPDYRQRENRLDFTLKV